MTSSSFPQLEGRSFRLAQEREFYKYANLSSPLFPTTDDPKSSIRSSSDAALTAFAQLGALRLNAQRGMISLVNRSHQYILAEATRTLSLQDDTVHGSADALWVGCCVIPKENGFCKYVAGLPQKGSCVDDKVIGGHAFVVPDLREDHRFNHAPMVQGYPYARFYAGVPIISPRGITIGSYCILDDKPRSGLDDLSLKFMLDTAATVMDHLEMARARDQHYRAERMIVGLGSFVEGKSSLRSEWVRQSKLFVPTLRSLTISEGLPNSRQQAAQRLVDHRQSGERSRSSRSRPAMTPIQPGQYGLVSPTVNSDSTLPLKPENSDKTVSVRSHPSEDGVQENMHSGKIKEVFSRAANIIRESIEVEGVAFLDARIGSYAGLVNEKDSESESCLSETATSEGENERNSESPTSSTSAGNEKTADQTTVCGILGYSTTTMSSIDNGFKGEGSVAVSELFLKALLRRYPRGKIFNFDESGSVSSDEGSDNIRKVIPRREDTKGGIGDNNSSRRTPSKRSNGRYIRQDADDLLKLLPGAKSIALVPLWDCYRSRWFSGCLIWTHNPQRVFTPEGELTYLAAFGDSAMAEAHRVDAEISDNAKTKLVSSISHEMRSPLHGIFGTAELLNETTMNTLQHGMVHTIESCAFTLLDTINHLLDFAQINKFKKPRKRKALQSIEQPPATPKSGRSKFERRPRGSMISLTSHVQLDAILEEVVESVYAGYSFYHRPQSPPPTRRSSMSMSTEGSENREIDSFTNPVRVIFDVQPSPNWSFHTQAGAWRRILMNLFGNALKYTKKGSIHVRITSESTDPGDDSADSRVALTVSDTGQGISSDFLQNSLFTPFLQEDPLAPGNGLGLSIARQAVISLGGYIDVSSRIGHGTEISVVVPLGHTPIPEDTQSSVVLKEVKNAVKGKTIGILGLEMPDSSEQDKTLSQSLQTTCQGWFGMEIVVPGKDDDLPSCDCYIALQHKSSLAESWDEQLPVYYGHFPSPVIVICHSPEDAHNLFITPRPAGDTSIVEFISQPCGPYKLAKALDMCLKQQTRGDNGVLDQLRIRRNSSRQSDSFAGPELPSPSISFARRARADSLQTSRRSSLQDQLSIGRSEGSENGIQDDRHNTASPAAQKSLPHRLSLSTVTNHHQRAVLLVEDNDLNLKLLIAYMKKGNHDYATAHNGQEAVEVYQSDPARFGAILMDISMPVMDGLEASRKIREIERQYQSKLDAGARSSWQPVTVVALTGLASGDAQQEAVASGMDLFLTKPVKMQELYPILKNTNVP